MLALFREWWLRPSEQAKQKDAFSSCRFAPSLWQQSAGGGVPDGFIQTLKA